MHLAALVLLIIATVLGGVATHFLFGRESMTRYSFALGVVSGFLSLGATWKATQILVPAESIAVGTLLGPTLVGYGVYFASWLVYITWRDRHLFLSSPPPPTTDTPSSSPGSS